MLVQDVAAPACDTPCERRAAADLIAAGASRDAVGRLRAALARFPDDPVLPLLLARAYLDESNLFWAERTLRDALGRRPDDADLRAWLACVHIRQGDPALVTADLPAASAPTGGAVGTRWRLAEAFAARLQGDDAAARGALAGVGRSAEVYPEDRPLRRMLQRQLDAWWLDPVSGTLDAGVGHTSNALAGSPTDPGRSGGPSGLGLLELRARVAPPVAGAVRPVLDVEVDGELIAAEQASDLSSLTGALRPGVFVGAGDRRLLVAYRGETLWLDQPDSHYSDAHRVEVELESLDGWVAAAGGGRRTYSDERRSRWEGDLGGGISGRLARGGSVAAGATFRLADASSPAWDQRGATLATAARLDLGRGFAARFTATAVWDDYPHSGGLEGLLAFGTTERRRDVLGRLTLGGTAPSWRGIRPALEWRLTRRDSTADSLPGFDFDYRESRVTLTFLWRFAADPWAPKAVRAADHVALDWGLVGDDGAARESILDLLRQDEELRRGSSCNVR